MELKKLMQDLPVKAQGALEGINICDLCSDSSQVTRGALFAAMRGREKNGEDFAFEAQERGAAAVLSERVIAGIKTPQIITGDVRSAYARVCAKFYGEPSKKLKTVGVTGTNGKSTTAYLIHRIACGCGIRCGLIGTMYIHDGERRSPAQMTTPDPKELNQTLARFVEAGCAAVAAEVSAHALYWRKTDGIVFDLGVFTNLSRDHLDFFGDMEEYARAKGGFFTPEHVRRAVINSDDEFGVRLINSVKVPLISYGLDNPADAFAVNIENGGHGRYIVNDRDRLLEINSRLYGKFNVSNALAAIVCARELGADYADIARVLSETPPPEGRFELIERDGVKFIVDFAHTPDGLENVLLQARKLTEGRLIAVFGCGGDRDRGKRPLMGAIASEYADEVLITSDNPRGEKREDIARDIIAGTDGRARVLLDRREALQEACNAARAGDTVVIAGKGSEKYIEEKGVKTYFDDVEVLKEILAEK